MIKTYDQVNYIFFKVINTQKSSLLNIFTIICAFEVIYIYYNCVVGIFYSCCAPPPRSVFSEVLLAVRNR